MAKKLETIYINTESEKQLKIKKLLIELNVIKEDQADNLIIYGFSTSNGTSYNFFNHPDVRNELEANLSIRAKIREVK